MDDRYLFLSTLDDVREKIRSGDKYKIVKASGLLRHLLIDEHPLLHQINRHYKLPIRFYVNDYKERDYLPGHTPTFHWMDLSPYNIKTKDTYRVKLDEFLAIVCVTVEGDKYTVKDIICSAAHIMGGVHSGKPKDERDIKFINLDKYIPIAVDPALMSIASICNVTLDALKDLEEKVKCS
jgi:hypothetical protein